VEGQNKSITFDGREIRLTTGLYAPQANGSVMIECGDTSLLVTATKTTKKEVADFLPLICDYEEKLYAAGRIPGGFMRREGRPPERATLISRLIDRPMRPLFPSWMRDEIQIVASCLSLDERVPADVLAVTGASIATLLGEIPFYGPMAAVRVGLIGDDFILNPSYREIEKGDLDIVVAGSPDGIVMIEAGANQLSEQDTIEAIDFGYEAVTELIKSQEDLLQDLGIKQIKPSEPEEDKTLPSYLEKNCTKPIELVLKKFDLSKEERDLELEKIKVETQDKINSLKEEKNLYVYQPKIDISGKNTFLRIISNKGTIAYDKNIVQLENKTEISGKVNEKVILGKASKVDIDLNKRNLSSNELIFFIDEYEISVKEIILNEDEIVFKGSPIYLKDNKGLETETSMVKLKSNGELIFPSKLNIKNY